MQTIKISATKARQEFFQILNWVFSGKSILVEKDNVVVASIVPPTTAFETRNRGLIKALDRASKGFSYSKSDNPLRRKGAASFLGRWDK